MAKIFGVCPRCGGTDIYIAKRQRITGLGGIYGNRAKMEDTYLCKACGENAEVDINSPENRELFYALQMKYTREHMPHLIVFVVLVIVVVSLLP